MVKNRGYYSLQPTEADVASLRLGPKVFFLTTQRLIEVRNKGWGASDIQSMGLESIDHVAISKKTQPAFAVFAALLGVGGIVLFGFSLSVALLTLGLSGFMLLLFAIARSHTLLVSSIRGQIRAEATGSGVAAARQFAAAIEEAKQARSNAFIARMTERTPDPEPEPETLEESLAQASPVGQMAASSPPAAVQYAELEALAGLRDRGIITAMEFDVKKRQLLGLVEHPPIELAFKAEKNAKALRCPQCDQLTVALVGQSPRCSGCGAIGKRLAVRKT